MIVPIQNREQTLVAAGVKREFLEALQQLEAYAGLRFVIKPPEGAYDYLPTIIGSYKILNGFTVTPVCDGANGDTFYVLLTQQSQKKFVYFSLESDCIYYDFGDDFQLLLAHIIIAVFEVSEESDADIIELAERIGFGKAPALIAALSELTVATNMQRWQQQELPRILAD